MSDQQTEKKKVIRLKTPSTHGTKPFAIKWEPEMDEMTIRHFINVVADEYSKSSQHRSQSEALRGLINMDIFHKGSNQSADMKVKDLIFDFKKTERGDVFIADIEFDKSAVAGI